jgi:hypothetical protein
VELAVFQGARTTKRFVWLIIMTIAYQAGSPPQCEIIPRLS